MATLGYKKKSQQKQNNASMLSILKNNNKMTAFLLTHQQGNGFIIKPDFLHSIFISKFHPMCHTVHNAGLWIFLSDKCSYTFVFAWNSFIIMGKNTDEFFFSNFFF